MIVLDRFEVGYIGGSAGSFSSPREALTVARELMKNSFYPGLAVIDRYARPGMTQVWAVRDNKLVSISRKER